LILRDVLDFSANETAEVLELTLSSVNSALNRARKNLARRYHGTEAEGPTSEPTDEKTQSLLDHYVQAWETADVDGLVALLKQDAILAMPPSPSWYAGGEAIGQFCAATVFGAGGMFSGTAAGRWRLLPTRANASPAFAIYIRGEQNRYDAFGLHVVACDRDRLSQITSFIDPSLPPRFGLPATLP
jgi:RNA polymerase sigma-70 factor (ECF subfamily)